MPYVDKEKQRAFVRAWNKAHRARYNSKERARAAVWRATHPEQVRARRQRHAEKHREEIREKSRVSRDKRRVRRRETDRAYYFTHRETCLISARAQTPIRRARVKQACPLWADMNAIRAIYAEAARLTRETGVAYEVDHFFPLRGENVSGLHCEQNLRIITRDENRRKHNAHPSPQE